MVAWGKLCRSKNLKFTLMNVCYCEFILAVCLIGHIKSTLGTLLGSSSDFQNLNPVVEMYDFILVHVSFHLPLNLFELLYN
jgi:hypothetical protein